MSGLVGCFLTKMSSRSSTRFLKCVASLCASTSAFEPNMSNAPHVITDQGRGEGAQWGHDNGKPLAFSASLLRGTRLERRGELAVDSEHLVVVHQILLRFVVRLARRRGDPVHPQRFLDLPTELEVDLLVCRVLVLLRLLVGRGRRVPTVFFIIVPVLFLDVVHLDVLVLVVSHELMRVAALQLLQVRRFAKPDKLPSQTHT